MGVFGFSDFSRFGKVSGFFSRCLESFYFLSFVIEFIGRCVFDRRVRVCVFLKISGVFGRFLGRNEYYGEWFVFKIILGIWI